MKTCSRCLVEKEITEYGKNTKTRDGSHNVCRKCNNLYNIQWRKDNPNWRINRKERARRRATMFNNHSFLTMPATGL